MSRSNVLAFKQEPQDEQDKKLRLALLAAGIVYVWNGRQYINLKTYRVVSARQLRGWVDSAIATSGKKIAILTERMIAGKISYPAWATTIQPELKAMHTGLATIALGGRENFRDTMLMNRQQLGRFGGRLNMLYSKLNATGLDYEQGRISGAQLLARMDMAVEAGRGTFEAITRGNMMEQGMREEMRVLGGSHHCEDCPPISGEWVPIGTLPDIGDTACLSNCNCTFEYR